MLLWKQIIHWKEKIKSEPSGFESGTSGSVVSRAIRCATGPCSLVEGLPKITHNIRFLQAPGMKRSEQEFFFFVVRCEWKNRENTCAVFTMYSLYLHEWKFKFFTSHCSPLPLVSSANALLVASCTGRSTILTKSVAIFTKIMVKRLVKVNFVISQCPLSPFCGLCWFSAIVIFVHHQCLNLIFLAQFHYNFPIRYFCTRGIFDYSTLSAAVPCWFLSEYHLKEIKEGIHLNFSWYVIKHFETWYLCSLKIASIAFANVV